MKLLLKRENIILIILFLTICYFPIFLHLDNLTLRMWDESRPAVNALQMTQDGNCLVTHFKGRSDTWFTKPPLLVWFQALSMKILGYTELAVRLPVAIACYMTAIFLFCFGWLFLKNREIGFWTGIILVSTNGYIDIHVARTGDVDGLMILWMTIYILSYFQYLHSKEKKDLYLAITIICLTLAILTKGIAGILAIPALFIYTIWQRKLKELITNPRFYLFALIPLVFAGGYYLLREQFNPGFLEAVNKNELGTRYTTAIEGQEGNSWMYLKQLITKTDYPEQGLFLNERVYPLWIALFPFCIISGLIHKNKLFGNLVLYCIIFIVSYLAIISFAQTKLYWYDAPLFPFFAIITAIACSQIYHTLLESLQIKSIRKQYLTYAVITLCIAFIPYKQVISKVYFPVDKWWGWERLTFGDYMKQVDKKNLKKYSVIHTGYNAHIVFYAGVFNHSGSNIHIDSVGADLNKFVNYKEGDIVLTCQPELKQKLEQIYNLKILEAETLCFTMMIINRKNYEPSLTK